MSFDHPDLTIDGGSLLLKAVDDRLGLTEAMTRLLVDSRFAGKIVHSFHDLFRQRIYALACGYADVNDVAHIGRDPLYKALLDRDPLSGSDLASQPTLSRFENCLGKTDLYRMSQALLNTVLDRHRKRLRKVRCITIDMDPTDDAAHGQQEFAFYNGHYRSWCYLQMPCFVSFGKESEQYLVALALRSGTAPAKQRARGILLRVIEGLRARFPKARLRVRLDGGFARLRCDQCRKELFVAWCKTRGFCPSCQAKRSALWAEWAVDHLLLPVRHHQWVFVLPKRLRLYFLYDRAPLGDMARCAALSIRRLYHDRAADQGIDPDGLKPGVASTIHTHGDFLNGQPHIHCLVTAGVADQQGEITALEPGAGSSACPA